LFREEKGGGMCGRVRSRAGVGLKEENGSTGRLKRPKKIGTGKWGDGN